MQKDILGEQTMYYYLTAFIAFVSVMILINATSIENTSIYTLGIVVLMIVSKWLFPSKPQRSKPEQKNKTKTANRTWKSNKQLKPEKNQYAIPSEIYEWPEQEDYDFDFEIVGESHYQSAISKIYQTWAEEQGNKSILPLDAYLIPEDNNPYDNKAVRVDINQFTVGYLSREDARSFRRRLGAKKLSGQITKCKAIITGGFELEDGSTASYGVALDMKPFE